MHVYIVFWDDQSLLKIGFTNQDDYSRIMGLEKKFPLNLSNTVLIFPTETKYRKIVKILESHLLELTTDYSPVLETRQTGDKEIRTIACLPLLKKAINIFKDLHGNKFTVYQIEGAVCPHCLEEKRKLKKIDNCETEISI